MSNECIKVMIRCRPLSKKELERGNTSIVNINHERNEIQLNSIDQNDAQKVFTYDAVFDQTNSQSYVYEQTAFTLVEQVVQGYNGTIFAYGQTGCGKTYSMIGDPKSEENKGLIPRTFQHIMGVIDSAQEAKFLVRCSYIEIYNEDIHDLLSKDQKAKRELKESPDKGNLLKKGVFIKDLSIMVCKTVEELDRWMNLGNSSRHVGATLMNADSSRSHSLFSIYIECQKTIQQQETITAGKLNLVDLAGSERQSKTGATGDRLKEATKINLSLSALGNVISALVDGKSQHIPYRDSKLTRLLQDSLGGNTKTVMIAAISPANYNYDETLGTLRYASRAKNIVNKPKINEDPKDALLKEYLDEIQKLKQMLQNQDPNAMASIQVNQQQINLNDFEKEKENIANELRLKDEKFQIEKQEREKLENIMKELEKNMVKGGQNKNNKDQQRFTEIRQNLEKEKKQKELILLQKKKQDDELEEIKNNYNNVQEEVQELRKVLQNLKKKAKISDQEVKDIQHENETQKAELLETIRIQQKENAFYEQIIQKVLKDDEMDKVRSSCEWQEDSNTYNIPLFVVRDKKVKFPSLVGQRLIDYVEKEKENREIQFLQKGEGKPQDSNRQKCNSFEEEKDGQNDLYHQIYNQNVTLNINSNINNKEKKTYQQNDKRNNMEINVKFQFNRDDQQKNSIQFKEDPIDEENFYENDFE